MITEAHLLSLNKFFESYGNALQHYDTKGMAYMYCYPCMILDDETSATFNDTTKLEGLFNKGISFYRQFGITYAVSEIWAKRQWSENIAKVRLNWKYYNADHQFLYDCEYDYLLRLDKHGDWKIQVAVSVNEKQHIEAWTASKK